MLRIKNKNIKIAFLFLLPAWFLFFISATRSYHSHIFTNGNVITHTQDDCKNEWPEQESEKNDDQTVVFHNLINDFHGKVAADDLGYLSIYYCTTVEQPSEIYKTTFFAKTTWGRAPPAGLV